MCLIITFDLIWLAFYRPIQWIGRLVRSTTVASLPIKSYGQCLMTLIYLWAFLIIGYCVKCCLELTFISRKKNRVTLLFPLSLLDRDLASRIDWSSLGPRMSTLNFSTLNFAAGFGMLNLGRLNVVEYLILNFLTLKNKTEYDLLS